MPTNSYYNSLGCSEDGYTHGRPTRYMEGSYCNTCHRWIGKGTLEYFMTEGYMSIRMALYNRSVKSSLPSYLKALCSRFESHAYIASLTERQAETLMWVTYALLALHGVNDNEACVELKP